MSATALRECNDMLEKDGQELSQSGVELVLRECAQHCLKQQ
jgi:hypothetical protein